MYEVALLEIKNGKMDEKTLEIVKKN